MVLILLFSLVGFQQKSFKEPQFLSREITKESLISQNLEIVNELEKRKKVGLEGVDFQAGKAIVNGGYQPGLIGVEHLFLFFLHRIEGVDARKQVYKDLFKRGFKEPDFQILDSWEKPMIVFGKVEDTRRNDLKRFKSSIRSKRMREQGAEISIDEKEMIINFDVETTRTATIEQLWGQVERLEPRSRLALISYLYEVYAPSMHCVVFLKDYGATMAPNFDSLGLESN